MRNGELIICGLTEWEKQTIKEHKGECRYCEHFDGFMDHGDIVDICSKEGKRKILLDKKNDCKDWKLDMR